MKKSVVVPFDVESVVPGLPPTQLLSSVVRNQEFEKNFKHRIITKIQSIFRMHRLCRMRTRKVTPQELLNVANKKAELLTGWVTLVSYLMFIGIFVGMLLSQRAPTDVYSVTAGLREYVGGVTSLKGGQWCKAQHKVLLDRGLMICLSNGAAGAAGGASFGNMTFGTPPTASSSSSNTTSSSNSTSSNSTSLSAPNSTSSSSLVAIISPNLASSSASPQGTNSSVSGGGATTPAQGMTSSSAVGGAVRRAVGGVALRAVDTTASAAGGGGAPAGGTATTTSSTGGGAPAGQTTTSISSGGGGAAGGATTTSSGTGGGAPPAQATTSQNITSNGTGNGTSTGNSTQSGAVAPGGNSSNSTSSGGAAPSGNSTTTSSANSNSTASTSTTTAATAAMAGGITMSSWVTCNESDDDSAGVSLPNFPGRWRDRSRIKIDDINSLSDAIDWAESFVWEVTKKKEVLWEGSDQEDPIYNFFRNDTRGYDYLDGTSSATLMSLLGINTTALYTSYMNTTRLAYKQEAMRIQHYNKVFGGIILRTRRGTMETCQATAHTPRCRNEGISKVNFSTPTFGFNKTLNSDTTGICPPFKYFEEAGGHTVFVPSGAFLPGSESFSAQILSWIRYHNFLDAASLDYSIKFATINPEKNVISTVDITFDFDGSGSVGTTVSVTSLGFGNTKWNALVLLFIVELAIFILVKIGEYFYALKMGHMRQTLFDLSNILTWMNFALYIYGIWHYSNDMDGIDSLMETINANTNELTRDNTMGDRMKAIITLITNISNRSDSVQSYFLSQGISLYLSLILLFKYLKFQRRLAIVTETLVNGLSDLVHFLLIYVSLLLLYAAIGNVLFGPNISAFSTFYSSFLTFFTWNLGNFDITDLINEYPLTANAVFWTYSVFVSLVILNMFLAIVVDSHSRVKQRSITRDDSVWRQWRWILKYSRLLLFRDKEYCSIFKTVRALKRYRNDNLNRPMTLLQIKIELERDYGVPPKMTRELIAVILGRQKLATTRQTALNMMKLLEVTQQTRDHLLGRKSSDKTIKPSPSMYPMAEENNYFA